MEKPATYSPEGIGGVKLSTDGHRVHVYETDGSSVRQYRVSFYPPAPGEVRSISNTGRKTRHNWRVFSEEDLKHLVSIVEGKKWILTRE